MRRMPPGQSPPTLPEDLAEKRTAAKDILRRLQGVMDTDVEDALADVRGILATLDGRDVPAGAGHDRMEKGGKTRARRKPKPKPETE